LGLRAASGLGPANLRFAHVHLRLKQQLLRFKDGNGIAFVEIPMSNSL
jgi:hypothetical protein